MKLSLLSALSGLSQGAEKGIQSGMDYGLKKQQLQNEADARAATLAQAQAKALQDQQEFGLKQKEYGLKEQEAQSKAPIPFDPADAPIVDGQVASPLADYAKYFPNKNKDYAALGQAPYMIPQDANAKIVEKKMETAGQVPITPELVQKALAGDPGAIATVAPLKGGPSIVSAYGSKESRAQGESHFQTDKGIQKQQISDTQSKDLEDKYNKRPDAAILRNLEIIDKYSGIISNPQGANYKNLPGRITQQVEALPGLGGLATLVANSGRSPEASATAAALRDLMNMQAHKLYGTRLTANEIASLQGAQGATPQDLASALRKIYAGAKESIGGLHKSHTMADQSITSGSDEIINKMDKGPQMDPKLSAELKRRGLLK